MAVLGVRLYLEVVPDTYITVGGEDDVLHLVYYRTLYEVPDRLVITSVGIEFHRVTPYP
jgi:hypothetical protein